MKVTNLFIELNILYVISYLYINVLGAYYSCLPNCLMVYTDLYVENMGRHTRIYVIS
jgi:hypothetical protein